MKRIEMKNNTESGFLITFCGIDGAGKSAIVERLKEELSEEYEQQIYVTKQPSEEVRKSAVFRAYMDCPCHDGYDYRGLSLMAAADRIQHFVKDIEPKLQKGDIVISDRYFYSCLANLRARGYVKDKWIYEISRTFIKPDIAFFCDLPVDVAIERVRARSEECYKYIDILLQYRLRDEYLNMCKKNHGILISTDCSFEESYQMVKKNVERVLKNEYKRKGV